MTVALDDSGTFSTVPGTGPVQVVSAGGSAPCAYELVVDTSGLGAESLDLSIFVAYGAAGSVPFLEETVAGTQSPAGWLSGPVPSPEGDLTVYVDQATGSTVDLEWALLRLS